MADAISKLDTSGFTVHKMSVDQAIAHLKTNIKTGLTSGEAEKRLEQYGANELDKEEEKSLWERIIEQFEDLLVRILLAAATISFIIAMTGKSRFGTPFLTASGQTRVFSI